jgi:hypothetical protein
MTCARLLSGSRLIARADAWLRRRPLLAALLLGLVLRLIGIESRNLHFSV